MIFNKLLPKFLKEFPELKGELKTVEDYRLFLRWIDIVLIAQEVKRLTES